MMKRLLPALLALPLLLGACASTGEIPPEAASGNNHYVRPIGLLATAWGNLPTYSLQPADLRQFRSRFSWMPVWMAGIDNAAKVDLLVNRDGTVRDVSILVSSGDAGKDSTVRARLDGVRITTKIAPEDPAPYVLRTVVVFPKSPWETSISISNYSAPAHYTEGGAPPANSFMKP
jgi:hypothetical protein